METLLVRIKSLDPRRGHVLRRYTYGGLQFDEQRGWYRVEPAVAEYLRTVRQIATDPYSPLAFDVCSESEARALEASEAEGTRRRSTDDLPLVIARGPATAPASEEVPKADEKDIRRGKREKE